LCTHGSGEEIAIEKASPGASRSREKADPVEFVINFSGTALDRTDDLAIVLGITTKLGVVPLSASLKTAVLVAAFAINL
jgi:hypothetical protein